MNLAIQLTEELHRVERQRDALRAACMKAAHAFTALREANNLPSGWGKLEMDLYAAIAEAKPK